MGKTKKKINRGNSKKSLKNRNKYGLYISPYLDNNKKVETIIVEKIMSDSEIAKKEAHYFDNKDYFRTINKDTDCIYWDDENKRYKILFRFRKGVITEKLSDLAYNCWAKYSKKLHNNRGAASGLLDRKKLSPYIGKLINPNGFRSHYIGTYTKEKHKQLISNEAPSNIIGYYDRFDRNIGQSKAPCRQTAFNIQHKELWDKSIPFIKRIDYLFKELAPDEHKRQYKRAQETSFVIANTAYSTLTINHNWRTALHKDAGDYMEGIGNLSVVEKGKYTGGCLGFPQFGIKGKGRINVDVRTGDFLVMDVHQWHCNTEIKSLDKTKPHSRLSIVAYLREGMLRCKGL